jgi:hypothetical protein
MMDDLPEDVRLVTFLPHKPSYPQLSLRPVSKIPIFNLDDDFQCNNMAFETTNLIFLIDLPAGLYSKYVENADYPGP